MDIEEEFILEHLLFKQRKDIKIKSYKIISLSILLPFSIFLANLWRVYFAGKNKFNWQCSEEYHCIINFFPFFIIFILFNEIFKYFIHENYRKDYKNCFPSFLFSYI